MDEHSEERADGSIAMVSSGSKGASSSSMSRMVKNLPASTGSSGSASASSSRAITPAVVPAQVPPCCDVGLACLDTSLVCCTDRECSDDGKQQQNNNETLEDCPQCETAAKEDANTPCTDPGCQLLEWDEQAVDELLRCCCSSDTAHGHRSFATTPYTATGTSITSIDGQYKHPAPPILPSSSNHARPPDEFRFLPPSNTNYTPYIPHLHTHTHLHPQFQSLPQLPPDSRSEASTSHSSSTNSFSFSSPALSSLSSGHTNNNNIQPLHLPSSSEKKKVYKCQWSLCPATFQDKESLIGHVNASHLMGAEAQSEEDVKVIPSASGMLGGAGDDSFENTLKCLWDSCSASLPILQVPSGDGNTNDSPSCLGHAGHAHGMHADSAMSLSVGGGGRHTTSCGGAHSHSMQTQPSLPLQDAPTATLVRHLLQDHLHIPSDVLSLLSPSLGVSNPLHAPSNTLHQPLLAQGQDIKPAFLPPATLTMASSAGNHYASPQQYTLPQYPHMNSPAHSHSSRPQSVASGSNCNSPAFPTFPQQHHQQQIPNLGSLHEHIRENDLKNLAKHARNASLDSLASSVLEASYGLQQTQQPWQSHSRNASMSELYSGTVSALPPSNAAGMDSANSSEVHLCGWKDCGASFSTTSALMEHISSSHIGSGKSIYYCHWVGCERAHSGRGFNQRQKIQRHLRTHVGDKPFICPFPGCLSKFSESTTLNQHIRTQHTSEKPFKCDFEGCGKSFALQSALTIHKRTHSGEKPFKCPIEGCGMRFAESSNLSKHVKTHRTNGEEAEMEGEQRKKRKRKSVALDEQDEEDEESDGILTSFGAQTNGTISGKTSRRQRSRN